MSMALCPEELCGWLPEFALMAFITVVEPALMTRVSIRDVKLSDQLKAGVEELARAAHLDEAMAEEDQQLQRPPTWFLNF